tara:strand:- start:251 stop:439 length:189 start_codon:yes stop_codon:yes gene_type:complete
LSDEELKEIKERLVRIETILEKLLQILSPDQQPPLHWRWGQEYRNRDWHYPGYKTKKSDEEL